MPRGNYALTFHDRPQGNGRNNVGAAHETAREAEGKTQTPRAWSTALVVLSVVLAVIVAVATDRLIIRRTAEARPAGDSSDLPVAFHVFWRGFLTGPQEPWVIFSNAAFVGRPFIGMRYYNRARDSGAVILDHYTGVGEVLAVHALDGVFVILHKQIRIKRGSLFSLDDAKNNDLIFIGSPFENLTLLEIPGTQEFIFRRMTSGSRKGEEAIVNIHPQPGESTEYFPSARNAPLTEDYAVVGLVKRLKPGQAVLILAGTTTIGTQAAVEFV